MDGSEWMDRNGLSESVSACKGVNGRKEKEMGRRQEDEEKES